MSNIEKSVDVTAEDMASVFDVLSEAGWVKSSYVAPPKVDADWTDTGLQYLLGIYAEISLPKLTDKQKQCLRYLAWQKFGDRNAQPPNLA